MRQILIQKKYIVAMPRMVEETGEMTWRFFVMIVNYFLNISKKSGKVVEEVKKEVVNMIDVTEQVTKLKMQDIRNLFANSPEALLPLGGSATTVMGLNEEILNDSKVMMKEIESKIISVKNIISESFLNFKNFLNNIYFKNLKNIENIFAYYFANKKFVFIKIYSQNNLNIKNNNQSDFEIYKNLLAPPYTRHKN